MSEDGDHSATINSRSSLASTQHIEWLIVSCKTQAVPTPTIKKSFLGVSWFKCHLTQNMSEDGDHSETNWTKHIKCFLYLLTDTILASALLIRHFYWQTWIASKMCKQGCPKISHILPSFLIFGQEVHLNPALPVPTVRWPAGAQTGPCVMDLRMTALTPPSVPLPSQFAVLFSEV